MSVPVWVLLLFAALTLLLFVSDGWLFPLEPNLDRTSYHP